MTDHIERRTGTYHDSVTLMRVSANVKKTDGVTDALIGMGTELNLDLIRSAGFEIPGDAGPNDLLIALRADDEEAMEAGRRAVEDTFAELQRASSTSTGGSDVPAPRTLAGAARSHTTNIAMISVPGQHAFTPTMEALETGQSVMLFSDNVPVEQEIVLKDAAAKNDALLMGPDCGTAVVNGVALGFANVTRSGSIGLIAASGTGAQQVMCLLDEAGTGVSHVLGLGGRDLSTAVGGRSARQAMAALAEDDRTESVIIVSKPADPTVVEALDAQARELDLNVHWATLSPDSPDLTAAVEDALRTDGHEPPAWKEHVSTTDQPSQEARGPYLRGLFCGGTMADEAMMIARTSLGPIRSNIPLDIDAGHDITCSGNEALEGNCVIDFGDDSMTQGRPHPMIDPSLRLSAITEQGEDASCGVLLLDLVLGYCAHPDPASDLADAIHQARSAAAESGRDLPVVISLIGTDNDPQGRQSCVDALTATGASVFGSNARATRHAISLLPKIA